MLWVAVVLFWVVFLTAFTLWVRPRIARLQTRREQIGDRQIDNRKPARTIALCVVGAVAATAVAAVVGFGPLGALLGSIVKAPVLAGVVYLTIRDADEAQTR
jgi:hypothetical protein